VAASSDPCAQPSLRRGLRLRLLILAACFRERVSSRVPACLPGLDGLSIPPFSFLLPLTPLLHPCSSFESSYKDYTSIRRIPFRHRRRPPSSSRISSDAHVSVVSRKL
jgi:hypothetical protein